MPWSQLRNTVTGWRRYAALGVVAAMIIMFVWSVASPPNDTDQSAKFHLSLIGGHSHTTVYVDKQRDAVRVTGAERGPNEFFVTGSRTLIRSEELGDSTRPGLWYSFRTEDLLPDGSLFDAGDTLEAFDVGIATCVLPDKVLDQMVEILIVQTFDKGEDHMKYNFCGGSVFGGSFVDGNGIRADREDLEDADIMIPPKSLRVVVDGSQPGNVNLLNQARSLFESPTK